jgi:hypothetical protein
LNPKLAVAVAAIIVFAAGIAAAEVIHAGRDEAPKPSRVAPAARSPIASKPGRAQRRAPSLPPASAGVQPSSGSTGALKPGAEASWARFSESVPAQIGLAVVPLGSASTPQTLGSLQSGHAWSSIKVPILVTLMREGEGLDAEEQALARAALTASDNEAAASLFRRLEQSHGGLEGASLAVQEVLGEAGDGSTIVNTAPPPPGAVSTYGQTEWSLSGSAEFFAALGAGCLLESAGTSQVLGLMEEVIPEQQWGLGEAGFPPEWQLGFKAGWGPEESASGPYLVRQSGIVRDGGAGVAVAMMALDESGSFEAGASDLTRIATWLRENLRTPLASAGQGC